jgi:uncharacterized protein YidB (DUF937 family)
MFVLPLHLALSVRSNREISLSPRTFLEYGFVKDVQIQHSTNGAIKLWDFSTRYSGAASGKTDASGEANSLVGILGGLLTQSGGLQGLANKFSQSGCGGAFASWVGMGENQSISSDQIQKCLGSDQVKTLAAKMGIDPDQASNLLAEFLPKVVDKLTPAGRVAADHQQGLAALVPSLLQSLSGSGATRT